MRSFKVLLFTLTLLLTFIKSAATTHSPNLRYNEISRSHLQRGKTSGVKDVYNEERGLGGGTLGKEINRYSKEISTYKMQLDKRKANDAEQTLIKFILNKKHTLDDVLEAVKTRGGSPKEKLEILQNFKKQYNARRQQAKARVS